MSLTIVQQFKGTWSKDNMKGFSCLSNTLNPLTDGTSSSTGESNSASQLFILLAYSRCEIVYSCSISKLAHSSK